MDRTRLAQPTRRQPVIHKRRSGYALFKHALSDFLAQAVEIHRRAELDRSRQRLELLKRLIIKYPEVNGYWHSLLIRHHGCPVRYWCRERVFDLRTKFRQNSRHVDQRFGKPRIQTVAHKGRCISAIDGCWRRSRSCRFRGRKMGCRRNGQPSKATPYFRCTVK